MTAPQSLHRQLTALHRQGGWAARLSLLLPLVAGVLLVGQTWILADVLHRAIVEHVPLEGLAGQVALIALLVAIRGGLGWLAESLAVTASEAVKRTLRRRLFGDLLHRSPQWTASRSSGALSSVLIEQVEALDGFLVRYMPAMTQAALLPIAFAAVVFPVDWVVGLIFVVSAPLIPVFMMLAGWGAEAASRAQAKALARLAGRFGDRLRGMVTLTLFGRAEIETAGIYGASEELRRRSMRVMRIAFLSSAVLEFFAALGVAGVALYSGLTLLDLVHVRTSAFTLDAALFCLLMAPEVYQPLRLLAAHYHDRAAAKAALQEITATLEAGNQPHSDVAPSIVASEAPRGADIVAVDLDIATPDGQPILKGANIELKAGAQIVLLGPSGVGKSTVLETLARLRPYTGSIELGGAELNRIAEPLLRTDLAFIGQRPGIFAGTIADNIRLGRPDACDTAVAAAARQALVTEFSARLPLGLATPVGENGLGLSGGEAQRIALARLFLRTPQIILLDEPTAHLDPDTENAVLDNILAFARGRTLLIATHSQAVAARMQHGYRIANGRLVTALLPRPQIRTTRGAA